eukprot:jgi/Botrbrau1/1895/Bobra.0005s0011.1
MDTTSLCLQAFVLAVLPLEQSSGQDYLPDIVRSIFLPLLITDVPENEKAIPQVVLEFVQMLIQLRAWRPLQAVLSCCGQSLPSLGISTPTLTLAFAQLQPLSLKADKQSPSPGCTDRPLRILAVYRILDALLTAASSAATHASNSEAAGTGQGGLIDNALRSTASGSSGAPRAGVPTLGAVQGGTLSGTGLHVPPAPKNCTADAEFAGVLACAVGTLLRGSLAAVAAAGQAENPRLAVLMVVACARAALLCRGTLAANTGAAVWEVGRVLLRQGGEARRQAAAMLVACSHLLLPNEASRTPHESQQARVLPNLATSASAGDPAGAKGAHTLPNQAISSTDAALPLLLPNQAKESAPQTCAEEGGDPRPCFDARHTLGFWPLIQDLLMDGDSGNRKAGMHLLKSALAGGALCASEQLPWSKFFQLYSILDEFPAHLVQPVWGHEMDFLHPAHAPGPPERQNCTAEEANCTTNQTVCTFEDATASVEGRSCTAGAAACTLDPSCMNRTADALNDHCQRPLGDKTSSALGDTGNPATEEPSAEAQACGSFGPAWEAVLWARGFAHPNPAVQKLVLSSFCSRRWGAASASILDRTFLRLSLLPCISSLACLQGADTMAMCESFFGRAMGSLSVTRRRETLEEVLQAFSSPAMRYVSAGLMVACLRQVAQAVGPSFDATWNDRVLGMLRPAFTRVTLYNNHKQQLVLYEGLLNATAAVVSPPFCTASAMATLLADIPLRLFRQGGPLYPLLQGWLLQTPEDDLWCVEGLQQLLHSYLKPPLGTTESSSPVHSADVEAWKLEAERWARLMWLGGNAGGTLKEGLMSDIVARAACLYSRPYLPYGSVEKILLLLLALDKASRKERGRLGGDRRLLASTQAGCCNKGR